MSRREGLLNFKQVWHHIDYITNINLLTFDDFNLSNDFIETWNELNNINFISTQTNRAPWLRICIGSIFQTFPIKKFLINPEGRLTVLRNSSKSFELSSETFLKHYPMKSIFPEF